MFSLLTGLQAGLNCSPFEAKAILNCVYEVYRPFFDNSASMKPGQICFEVVGVENSAKDRLCECQMKTVVLTLDGGANDLAIREQLGVIGLRRHRLERIANEAFQQGGLLTVEDVANRLLNCGERTVTRDIQALKEKGICLPLRSTVRDMGRSVTHRQMIVKHWLEGMEFSEIARRTCHIIEAVSNYVEKFKRVVCLTKENYEISTIAFLIKISIPLAQQYYDLYQTLDRVDFRKKELDELLKKTIVQH
jgi:transposase